MDNQMLLISKVDLNNLIKHIEKLTEVLSNLNGLNVENKFFTRDEAMEHYNLSRREVDKIYNTILKDKVIDIGKNQRLAKVHIDKMFMNGVKQKYV